MNRIINQINVSITTNRTCTLRCDHCYIAPHLFDDKSQMSTATFRKIFDQIERLYDLDHRLEEIEWEAIGGETTMMPFAWWEENLPWALDRIEKINQKIGKNGALNFLTNLVYSDKRYTSLINKYGYHPAFCLYTSWEPDTGRFGKNNKLFPKFLETLKSIDCRQKILDVILTKEVIRLGPEYLIETFVPLGITDFSIKMLSPYGSGKQFFEDNMIDFDAMSKYLIRLGEIKPDHITYTPQDEMQGSLYRGTSFQCNGNFQYDLAIEPDGSCTFNANQTADEAVIGSKVLNVYDDGWAQKVIYENKQEENNKLTLAHPACEQCEFMRYCNAGWYHYKIHDPQKIRLFDLDDCSGYKKMWELEKAKMGSGLFDVSGAIHNATVERVKAGKKLPQEGAIIHLDVLNESELPKKYDEYFNIFSDHRFDKALRIDGKRRFFKTIEERIWFYESFGVPLIIDSIEFLNEPVVRHWLSRNYKHLYIAKDLIQQWIKTNPDEKVSIQVAEFSQIWHDCEIDEGSQKYVIVDNRNEEMFRTIIDVGLLMTCDEDKKISINADEHAYISKLKLYKMIENAHAN